MLIVPNQLLISFLPFPVRFVWIAKSLDVAILADIKLCFAIDWLVVVYLRLWAQFSDQSSYPLLARILFMCRRMLMCLILKATAMHALLALECPR